MKLPKGASRDLIFGFAAGATMLLASLANFLSYNDYPFSRPEVGLVVIGTFALAASIAFFYRAQRQWGRSVLEGLLAALFIDLNTDSIPLILVVGSSVAAITIWRRISLLRPMAILFAVVLLTTAAGIGGRSSWITTAKGDRPGGKAADKPAIVHLVLDEHIGLEGLPYETPGGSRLREELRQFYLANGFAIYGGAYSQHYHSANSIPYILNYGAHLAPSVQENGVHAGPTAHLQSLVKQGYKLTVFENDYADFCSGADFAECVTYDSSSLRPTLDVPMTVPARAELITHKLVKLSDILGVGWKAWNLIVALLDSNGLNLPPYNSRAGNSSTVGTLETMDDLARKLRALQPGEAVFAHLLLPHHPYVVRGDCAYLPWKPWVGLRTNDPLPVKRAQYHDQLRCTTRQIGRLLSELSKSPAGANAVVIIHGDHGSRMSRMGPKDQTTAQYGDEDMIEVFSTLFVVRGPGIPPGYSTDRRPVAQLLKDFAGSRFRRAPHPPQPAEYAVYLTDSDWKPVRKVALPTSWTNQSPIVTQPDSSRVSH